MTDPKQIEYVPVVASNPQDGFGDNYPTGSDAWSGTPIIVEPNLGTQAAGLTPGTGSWFTAQTANFLLNSYGKAIEAMIDAPSFQRNAQLAYFPGNSELSNAGDASTGNTLLDTSDPPLMHVSYDQRLLIQQANPFTGTVGHTQFAVWREGQGQKNAGSTDTFPFKIPAFTGATTMGPAESGKAVVMVARRDSSVVLACGAANATIVSTDMGENWSAGQSLPASANWKNPLCGCVLNGVWYVVDAVDSTVTVNRLNYTSDPAGVAWTAVGSSVGGADTGHTRRLIPGSVNGGTLVMLPAAGTHFGSWKVGDASVTPYFLTGSADNTRTGWKGAWNEQIGLFMIANIQGDAWTSADGFNWTQVYVNDSGLETREIISHGRGFMISNSASSWDVDYCALDHTGAWVRRRVLRAYLEAGGGAFHLVNIAGRWLAGRLIKNSTWELEWYFGGVDAFDRNSYVGR